MPEIGRWASRDPLGEMASASSRALCGMIRSKMTFVVSALLDIAADKSLDV